MINTPIPTIEINIWDNEVIHSMYKATLKAERGYVGLVTVDAHGLYEKHMASCMLISRHALEKVMINARQN